MATNRKRASEAAEVEVTSEVREEPEKELSTSEAEVATIAVDDYLKAEKVNPGLVASYRVEAVNHPEMLAPRTSEGWAQAFREQANRVYE